jgi:hypothetical protein
VLNANNSRTSVNGLVSPDSIHHPTGTDTATITGDGVNLTVNTGSSGTLTVNPLGGSTITVHAGPTSSPSAVRRSS